MYVNNFRDIFLNASKTAGHKVSFRDYPRNSGTVGKYVPVVSILGVCTHYIDFDTAVGLVHTASLAVMMGIPVIQLNSMHSSGKYAEVEVACNGTDAKGL